MYLLYGLWRINRSSFSSIPFSLLSLAVAFLFDWYSLDDPKEDLHCVFDLLQSLVKRKGVVIHESVWHDLHCSRVDGWTRRISMNRFWFNEGNMEYDLICHIIFVVNDWAFFIIC